MKFWSDFVATMRIRSETTIILFFSEALASNNERGGQAEFGMREVHIILERKLIQLFCFVQAHDLWKIPTSSKRTSPCFSGWSKPTNLIEELNYFFPDVSSSFIVQRIIHVFFSVQTKIDLALLLEGHYVFLVSHCLISQLSTWQNIIIITLLWITSH